MAKYSGRSATRAPRKPNVSAPISATDTQTLTYNGDEAYVRDAKSELFVLAVNFMGETEETFYESGNDSQARLVALIHQVTNEDAKWMQHFIPFLRTQAFMRTASVVAAAEYVRAGGPEASSVVDAALHRADEPSELLGYWTQKYGRQLPMALKRGLAKAARRLYTEFNLLKYDTPSHGVRFGDVLELVHPRPTTDEQNSLFGYALDRRHHPTEIRTKLSNLAMISSNQKMRAIQPNMRRELLRSNTDAKLNLLSEAGFTWESLSEWLPGGMDAEAWEWMIPSMGYMALLRNLRNFDQAGVSDDVADKVIARLSDPAQVAKSMQFPFRFWSAFKNVESNRWGRALDKALDLSTDNIPKLKGRSLVLIDVSGSMRQPISGNSSLVCAEAAAVFGTAQYRAAGFEGDLVAFGDYSEKIELSKGASVLKGAEKVMRLAQTGKLGWDTAMWEGVARHFDHHDRIFLFTDMQANTFAGQRNYPCPIYFWNLVGYQPAAAQVGSNGIYEVGGLSDKTFRQIALLEAAKNASWPWEENLVG